jgi:hypothetical protein
MNLQVLARLKKQRSLLYKKANLTHQEPIEEELLAWEDEFEADLAVGHG